MKWMHRLPWLTLGMLLLIAGCGGGGDNGDPGRFDPQIFDAYSRLISAVEGESLNQLELLVSEDYLQDGTDDAGFLATFSNFFEDYRDIEMTVDILDIEYDDADLPEFALVQFDQILTGYNLDTQRRETVDNARREMVWVYENQRWRMFGNQEDTPQALSLRRAAVKELLGKPQGQMPRSFPGRR